MSAVHLGQGTTIGRRAWIIPPSPGTAERPAVPSEWRRWVWDNRFDGPSVNAYWVVRAFVGFGDDPGLYSIHSRMVLDVLELFRQVSGLKELGMEMRGRWNPPPVLQEMLEARGRHEEARMMRELRDNLVLAEALRMAAAAVIRHAYDVAQMAATEALRAMPRIRSPIDRIYGGAWNILKELGRMYAALLSQVDGPQSAAAGLLRRGYSELGDVRDLDVIAGRPGAFLEAMRRVSPEVAAELPGLLETRSLDHALMLARRFWPLAGARIVAAVRENLARAHGEVAESRVVETPVSDVLVKMRRVVGAMTVAQQAVGNLVWLLHEVLRGPSPPERPGFEVRPGEPPLETLRRTWTVLSNLLSEMAQSPRFAAAVRSSIGDDGLGKVMAGTLMNAAALGMLGDAGGLVTAALTSAGLATPGSRKDVLDAGWAGLWPPVLKRLEEHVHSWIAEHRSMLARAATGIWGAVRQAGARFWLPILDGAERYVTGKLRSLTHDEVERLMLSIAGGQPVLLAAIHPGFSGIDRRIGESVRQAMLPEMATAIAAELAARLPPAIGRVLARRGTGMRGLGQAAPDTRTERLLRAAGKVAVGIRTDLTDLGRKIDESLADRGPGGAMDPSTGITFILAPYAAIAVVSDLVRLVLDSVIAGHERTASRVAQEARYLRRTVDDNMRLLDENMGVLVGGMRYREVPMDMDVQKAVLDGSTPGEVRAAYQLKPGMIVDKIVGESERVVNAMRSIAGEIAGRVREFGGPVRTLYAQRVLNQLLAALGVRS